MCRPPPPPQNRISRSVPFPCSFSTVGIRIIFVREGRSACCLLDSIGPLANYSGRRARPSSELPLLVSAPISVPFPVPLRSALVRGGWLPVPLFRALFGAGRFPRTTWARLRLYRSNVPFACDVYNGRGSSFCFLDAHSHAHAPIEWNGCRRRRRRRRPFVWRRSATNATGTVCAAGARLRK